MPDSQSDSRIAQQVSRRRVLAVVGTALVGGTLATAAVSRPARAAVSVDKWSVEDASFETESVDPVAEAQIAWEYEVDQTADVSYLWLALSVNDTVVASEELSTDRTSLSNETDLSGALVDSDAFEESDFSVEPGESVDHDVTVAVALEVRDTDDDAIADASAEETATVEITHPEDEPAQAAVGGVVSIVDDN